MKSKAVVLFMRVVLPGALIWFAVLYFVDVALGWTGLDGGLLDYVRGFIAGALAAESFDLWWRQFKDITMDIWERS